MDLQELLMKSVDRFMEWTAPTIHTADLARLRELVSKAVVAHRGETQNGRLAENSVSSFSAAQMAWGLELDIRWTRDHIPVVHHDRSLQRLFGINRNLADCSFDEFGTLQCTIAGLREIIAEFGPRQHLMLELKTLPKDIKMGLSDLRTLLETSGANYHLMSIDLEILKQVDASEVVAPSKLLTIAEWNIDACSRLALERGWGGLTGHYLLLTQKYIDRHHEKGQKVGTGFVDTPSLLARESKRGIDWYFSNQAASLHSKLQELK